MGSEANQPTPIFRELSRTHTFALETRATLGVQKVRLTVVEGPDTGRRIETEAGSISLGGSSDLSLPLKDRSVSRVHCTVRRTPQGYQVVDAGSTNGTYLDGNRVDVAYLQPGARITIGRSTVEFDAVVERVEIEAHRSGELGQMVGRSQQMQHLFGLMKKIAPMEITALICGETGTGKELAARAIHDLSKRAQGPFIVVDCGTVTSNLIESELFGHEKGAFTGATTARVGAFEAANGGTIFLDEIGELPLELQPKLLRVLQQRQVRRVGSNDYRDVNVRVVAATNRDLELEVRQGNFREDLFYRLNVVNLELPALRKRRDDIPWLARRLLRDLTQESQKPRKTLSPEAIDRLMAYRWPGNVRELANIVRRAAVLAPSTMITDEELPPTVRKPGRQGPSLEIDVTVPLKEAREQLLAGFERAYLVALLRGCRGNISEAARRSGVHRKTVERLVKKHGLDRHDAR